MDKLIAVKKLLLPCKLSPEEITAVGDELSAVIEEHREVDEERKAVAAKFSARLKGLVAKMQILGRKHTAKMEEREVEVEERIDSITDRKYVMRLDDFSIVGPRGPGQEQQLEIAGKRIIDQAEAARSGSVPAPGPIRREPPPATEEQTAESPEEAEAIREARLAADAAAAGDEVEPTAEVPLPDDIAPPPASDIPPAGVTQSEHDIARADRVSSMIERLRPRFEMIPVAPEIGVFVVKVDYLSGRGEGDLSPKTMEADGVTEDEARDALLEKLILHVGEQPDDFIIEPAKKLLKGPKREKKLTIELVKEVTKVLPPEERIAPPLCAPDCEIDHEHTEQRTAF